jgi:hypothetical protein
MAMKYDCHVTKDEKVQFRFSCGSYDMTNRYDCEDDIQRYYSDVAS